MSEQHERARSHLLWVLGEAHAAAADDHYAHAYGLLRQAGMNLVRATDDAATECWCDDYSVAPCRYHNRCPVCGDSWATHSAGSVLLDIDEGEERYEDEDRFTCGAGHTWDREEAKAR